MMKDSGLLSQPNLFETIVSLFEMIFLTPALFPTSFDKYIFDALTIQEIYLLDRWISNIGKLTDYFR